jgi:hypothetical protein
LSSHDNSFALAFLIGSPARRECGLDAGLSRVSEPHIPIRFLVGEFPGTDEKW